MAEFHPEFPVLKFGNARFHFAAQTQAMTGIELHLRASFRPGRNCIGSEQRCIDDSGNRFARVTAFHGNVPADKTDSSHARTGLVRRCGRVLRRRLLSERGNRNQNEGGQTSNL